MEAGALRHRLTIQSPPAGQDWAGQRSGSWTTFGTRWGSLEPLAGRELEHAQRVVAEVTHRVQLRFLDGVTARMRISFDSRTFEILSVRNIAERNVELELLCKETG